jgi:hypothetical protein
MHDRFTHSMNDRFIDRAVSIGLNNSRYAAHAHSPGRQVDICAVYVIAEFEVER